MRLEDFKTIYNVITDVWRTVSKYKYMDIKNHEDAICMDMVNELQAVRNKYQDKRSGKLAGDLSTAILHYIFFKENRNDK